MCSSWIIKINFFYLVEKLIFLIRKKFLIYNTRFWPTGRGFFINEEKNFLLWCNEEDHLRFISLDTGGDLGVTYRRLVKGMQELEKYFSFVKDQRLGYLSSCPSNLGMNLF
jgi:protein-arginine kinase